MREMEPALTRDMAQQPKFMQSVNELLQDRQVLSEMAERGGAPAETLTETVDQRQLEAFALVYVTRVLREEMARSYEAFAAEYGTGDLQKHRGLRLEDPQGRTLYRLRLEAEQIRRETAQPASQERPLTQEHRITAAQGLSPEKAAAPTASEQRRASDARQPGSHSSAPPAEDARTAQRPPQPQAVEQARVYLQEENRTHTTLDRAVQGNPGSASSDALALGSRKDAAHTERASTQTRETVARGRADAQPAPAVAFGTAAGSAAEPEPAGPGTGAAVVYALPYVLLGLTLLAFLTDLRGSLTGARLAFYVLALATVSAQCVAAVRMSRKARLVAGLVILVLALLFRALGFGLLSGFALLLAVLPPAVAEGLLARRARA